MGRKKKPITTIAERVPESPKDERDLQMFKDWIKGLTHAEIATRYGVSTAHVSFLSSKHKWREARASIRKKRYSLAIQSLQEDAADLISALKKDFRLTMADQIKTNRTFNKDERKHFMDMLDRFLKETRLEDGKPTDVLNNNHKIEVVLPAGVTHFGVIPPPSNSTIKVTNKPKEVEKIKDPAEEYNDIDPEEL